MTVYLSCEVPEPLWTYEEKEKFWAVFESYLEQLVSGEFPLPYHSIDLSFFDPSSDSDRKICCKRLREDMWTGRYSLAVANFKAMKEFFHHWMINCDSEISELKQIFMEKPLRR